MRLRSNCNCHCHGNDHITLHEKPCCIKNPTIGSGWEELKTLYTTMGISEKDVETVRLLYYLGASRTIGYIILLKDLDPLDAMQMLNDLSKEIIEFIERNSEKKQ